jgi:hypothetical protein
MIDKELLELAAKAIEIDYFSNTDGTFIRSAKSGRWVKWNPLTDDGDALRLAVKLKIDIHFEWNSEAMGNIVEAFTPEREDGSRGCFDNSTESDPYAATRRAITRAAAEIGRVSQ